MFRLLIILLIAWLPLQSIAATLCPHRTQLDATMAVHHADSESVVLDSAAHTNHDSDDDTDHDTDTNVAHTDTHCAACHLGAVNSLTSDNTNYYFPQAIRFPSAIVNQPPTVVSAVPEPVPLALAA